MKHTLDKQEKYCLIKLHEDKLNSLVSPELKAEFVVMNGEGVKNIIIDLSETQYCDSSGLSAILVGNRLCRDAKGCFIITGLKEPVKKLITISQLEQVLNITPSVSEGIDLIVMEQIERDIKDE
jgi:anti-sigma B factor antagonist